jgi:group I intron endonuclease
MRTDGLENFSFEIIEEIENEKLFEREIYWIDYYDSLVPNGYNLTKGGEGTYGYSRPQSIEEREKRGESIRQFYIDHPEKREEKSQQMKKLWEENEDFRNQLIEAGKKFHEEHPDFFKGENNPMYGKKHSEESLEKIRTHAATRKMKIAQLDKETLEIIHIFDGVKDAEKALEVSHGWISKAARSDKIAYGYRWKFL